MTHTKTTDDRPLPFTIEPGLGSAHRRTAAEGFLPQGAAALYRREEFSEEVIIENLEPGERAKGSERGVGDIAVIEVEAAEPRKLQ